MPPGQKRLVETHTLKRLIIASQIFVTVNILSTLLAAAAGGSFKFGGIPFSPGAIVRANVPLNALEKSYAGQGGNPVPPYALAVLATPVNFDPTKSWPVLIPCSTSDFKRQNRDDLIQFYHRVGLSEGWVLLAGDGPQHAQNDIAAWRAAMTMAAIDAFTAALSGRRSGRWRARGSRGEAKALVTLRPSSQETVVASPEFT